MEARMSNKVINSFEITEYSLKVRTPYEKGKRCEYEYCNISKDVIKKFINASKAPTVSEVEDWVKADREKRDLDSDRAICCETGFWS